MLDFRATLDLHQNLISGQDGHALYNLPDGVFIPFCDCRRGVLYGLRCLLHAVADAVSIHAASQNRFFLLFERSLLGQDFCKLRIAGFFIFCINGFRQKLLELPVELRQSAFNVGKTLGLTLYWQKLYGNCILDKVEQGRFVAHGGVDGCQNRVLQRFFLDRRGVVAVFCAVIQTAGAAPYGVFSPKRRPCASAVECPAFAADESVR